MSVQCDFHLDVSRNAVWLYQSKRFADRAIIGVDETHLYIQDENWAACEACAALIEQGLDAMLAAAELALADAPPNRRARTLRGCENLWTGFLTLRLPGRRRLTEHELAEGAQRFADGQEQLSDELHWIDRHVLNKP